MDEINEEGHRDLLERGEMRKREERERERERGGVMN